jgi:hypothetical protein
LHREYGVERVLGAWKDLFICFGIYRDFLYFATGVMDVMDPPRDIGPKVQVDRTTDISGMNEIVYYWKPRRSSTVNDDAIFLSSGRISPSG